MYDVETGIVTCPSCSQAFHLDDMPPQDPDEEANTQVYWLICGRCLHCGGHIEISLDEVREKAGKVSRGES